MIGFPLRHRWKPPQPRSATGKKQRGSVEEQRKFRIEHMRKLYSLGDVGAESGGAGEDVSTSASSSSSGVAALRPPGEGGRPPGTPGDGLHLERQYSSSSSSFSSSSLGAYPSSSLGFA